MLCHISPAIAHHTLYLAFARIGVAQIRQEFKRCLNMAGFQKVFGVFEIGLQPAWNYPARARFVSCTWFVSAFSFFPGYSGTPPVYAVQYISWPALMSKSRNGWQLCSAGFLRCADSVVVQATPSFNHINHMVDLTV
jgi:hypothetical protein